MNSSTRALKVSIIVQWVLIALAVAFGLYEERYLPEVLKSYIIERDNNPLSSHDMLVMGSGLLLAVGLLVSSVGIYRLRKWSRKPYVTCSVLGAVLFMFMGPSITPPIEGTVLYLANTTEGFTIAMLFFSSAKEHFESSNQYAREGR